MSDRTFAPIKIAPGPNCLSTKEPIFGFDGWSVVWVERQRFLERYHCNGDIRSRSEICLTVSALPSFANLNVSPTLSRHKECIRRSQGYSELKQSALQI